MTTTSARWPFRLRDAINQVEIAPRVTTDNGEAALRLALNGAGIIRLRDMMVGGPIRPVSALYLAGRQRVPKARVFLDFLVERFGSAPWRIELNKRVIP